MSFTNKSPKQQMTDGVAGMVLPAVYESMKDSKGEDGWHLKVAVECYKMAKAMVEAKQMSDRGEV